MKASTDIFEETKEKKIRVERNHVDDAQENECSITYYVGDPSYDEQCELVDRNRANKPTSTFYDKELSASHLPEGERSLLSSQVEMVVDVEFASNNEDDEDYQERHLKSKEVTSPPLHQMTDDVKIGVQYLQSLEGDEPGDKFVAFARSYFHYAHFVPEINHEGVVIPSFPHQMIDNSWELPPESKIFEKKCCTGDLNRVNQNEISTNFSQDSQKKGPVESPVRFNQEELDFILYAAEDTNRVIAKKVLSSEIPDRVDELSLTIQNYEARYRQNLARPDASFLSNIQPFAVIQKNHKLKKWKLRAIASILAIRKVEEFQEPPTDDKTFKVFAKKVFKWLGGYFRIKRQKDFCLFVLEGVSTWKIGQRSGRNKTHARQLAEDVYDLITPPKKDIKTRKTKN